jgi:hypothetical protein
MTRKKDTNMKTNRLSTILRPSCLALIATAIGALTLASAVNAQSKSASDDGIAASPKARQVLTERKASAATAAATAAAPAMACPLCADVQTAKVSPQAKGGEVLVGAKQVAFSHACAGCETKIAVAGEGKARHSVATHNCSADVPNKLACCASN